MKIYLFFALIFLAISCATDKATTQTQAEQLYQDAQRNVKAKRYLLAIEKLNTIKSQHPYSIYASKAELMLADILFLQEEYVEATLAYISFREIHPRYENLEYIIWRIAESYYNQLPAGYDRDLSNAFHAISYYEEYKAKYPSGEYVKDAEEKIKICQKKLQDKEKYIADFYYKTSVYDAAIVRYNDILKNFKDKELIDHAKLRLVLSNLKLKKYGDCMALAVKYLPSVMQSTQISIRNAYQTCKYLRDR